MVLILVYIVTNMYRYECQFVLRPFLSDLGYHLRLPYSPSMSTSTSNEVEFPMFFTLVKRLLEKGRKMNYGTRNGFFFIGGGCELGREEIGRRRKIKQRTRHIN